MKIIDVKIPSLGESISEATIAKWLKKKGDLVEKDEVIVEIETDKVTQEIYAEEKGKINKTFFDEGEDVKIGDIIANLEIMNSEKVNTYIKEESDNSNQIDIIIPNLGESITEATIGKWEVKEGEDVKEGQVLVEIETDKVTQELYAEKNGKISKILFQETALVKIGDKVATFIVDGNTSKDQIKKETADNEVEKNEAKVDLNNKDLNLDPTAVRRSDVNNKINLNDLKEFVGDISLTPSARKYVNEKFIEVEDLEELRGEKFISKDNIIKKSEYDNKEKIQDIVPSDKKVPLSKLRISIGNRLKKAQNTAAMLTTFNEIDMSSVINLRNKYKEAFQKKYDVKLGFMSFFTKASIIVLKEIPEINAEIENENIIYKNRYDIGIAVGSKKGLLVPVVKKADNLSFAEIEKKIREYSELANENKITPDHMSNGTFTISNGGTYGSMLSTPILNTPQSGILGLHNIVKRPVVIKDEILIRPIMFVALTYDHRIIDGKEAVTFLVRLKQIIENPEEILFEI